MRIKNLTSTKTVQYCEQKNQQWDTKPTWLHPTKVWPAAAMSLLSSVIMLNNALNVLSNEDFMNACFCKCLKRPSSVTLWWIKNSPILVRHKETIYYEITLKKHWITQKLKKLKAKSSLLHTTRFTHEWHNNQHVVREVKNWTTKAS